MGDSMELIIILTTSFQGELMGLEYCLVLIKGIECNIIKIFKRGDNEYEKG
jgi:hypothetical protein